MCASRGKKGRKKGDYETLLHSPIEYGREAREVSVILPVVELPVPTGTGTGSQKGQSLSVSSLA